MKKIYSLLQHKSVVFFLSLSLLSNVSFGQSICGNVAESFSTSAAGFTGDFSYDPSPSQKLIRRNVIGTAIYSVTTPTYQLAASATSLGYGFILDGTEQVARVEVVVVYISTLTNQATTIFLNQFVPNYGAGTSSSVCRAISTSDLPGFPANGKYRFRIDVTSNTGTGLSGQTITFDDFRTNGTAALSPLPVSFIGFDAKKTTAGAQLTWKIAGEENVNHYEVERSEDGRNFASIAEVSTSKKATYTYMDASALSTVYYRIKNVDNDGKFKYSTIARIANDKSSIVIKAFPQPAVNQLTIQHPSVKSNASITISTADGRMVKALKPGAGTMQTFVDVSGLQKGMYIVRFNDGDGNTETMKVVKQ